MDLNTYQTRAMTFRTPEADARYALYNLSGEVGELHSLIAKAIRDGAQPYHYENIKKELGDILWHVAAVAQDSGFTLGDVAYTNIEKLQDRLIRGAIKGSGDDR